MNIHILNSIPPSRVNVNRRKIYLTTTKKVQVMLEGENI